MIEVDCLRRAVLSPFFIYLSLRILFYICTMNVSKAVKLTKKLLIMNGLIDWRVSVSMDRENPGICDYDTKSIVISSLYFPRCTDRGALNVIIHEIAHALCPFQGHNEVWKKKCIELGGNGQIFFDPTESLKDIMSLTEIL